MRPHMQHLAHTMVRKQMAAEAGNKQSSYSKYRKLVLTAKEMGFSNDQIIEELELEKNRIKKDIRVGDSIFQQGVANSQNACMVSIALIISELKGEN